MYIRARAYIFGSIKCHRRRRCSIFTKYVHKHFHVPISSITIILFRKYNSSTFYFAYILPIYTYIQLLCRSSYAGMYLCAYLHIISYECALAGKSKRFHLIITLQMMRENVNHMFGFLKFKSIRFRTQILCEFSKSFFFSIPAFYYNIKVCTLLAQIS